MERKYWTEARIVETLQALAEQLGRTPAARDVRAAGYHPPGTSVIEGYGSLPTVARRRFGSWSAAIDAAGLTKRKQGEYAVRSRRRSTASSSAHREITSRYETGDSIQTIADALNYPLNHVRDVISDAGVLRSQAEAVSQANRRTKTKHAR